MSSPSLSLQRSPLRCHRWSPRFVLLAGATSRKSLLSKALFFLLGRSFHSGNSRQSQEPRAAQPGCCGRGDRPNDEDISEEKYLLKVFSPQLSKLGGKEALGIDHANEIPVVGRLALTLPIIEVVGVVAMDVDPSNKHVTFPLLAVSMRPPKAKSRPPVSDSTFRPSFW